MPGVKRTIANPLRVDESLNAVRRFAQENTDHFIQKMYKVVDKKSNNVVDFTYKWEQAQAAKFAQQQADRGDPIRQFLLKSRQVGTSTQFLARGHCKVWANDNYEAVIVAHLEKRAEELLTRCKAFHAWLPPELRMVLSQDSKQGMRYADSRSLLSILASAAVEDGAARSGTKRYGQLSEWAYYKKAILVLSELAQVIDYVIGTEIYIETTGKGYGSDCHEYWKRCKAKKEPFEAHFLAWQENPLNDPIFKSDYERDRALAIAYDYEPRLEDRKKQFALTAGNIWQAYSDLRNKCFGDWEFYCQEYPCDDDEAWRATGASYFGAHHLNALKPLEFTYELFTFGVKTPLGHMFDSFSDLDKVDKIDENGIRAFFKVWKRPHANGWYVVSGDSAHGEEDGNFSSSFVVDMNTLEMMAEFHGKVRPDEHAHIIESLCGIYNGALAAPEYNQPGNATLLELKRNYFNIYRWKYLDDYKFKESNKLGWQTNSSSRPLMLALAKRLIEDLAQGRILNKGMIKSVALVNEMKTFVNNDDGRPEAAPGCNDDRVMAWCIAIIVASQETAGTQHDILSIYKTVDTERKANVLYRATESDLESLPDPEEVIRRLSGDLFHG